jgi:hypothetical protein
MDDATAVGFDGCCEIAKRITSGWSKIGIRNVIVID